MDANSYTVSRFKAQANKLSGIISKGLSAAKPKLVKQLVYGIQDSRHVKLSNISRALKEDIPLIKTEDRLNRNLKMKILLSISTNKHCVRAMIK